MAVSDAVANQFFSTATSFLTQQGDALGTIVDFATAGDARSGQKNADDCWYGPTCQALAALTPLLITAPTEYTRTTAIQTAQSTVASIFLEYSEQDLPQIYQAQNASGGWNSTTAQLLANDAFAKANSKAAQIVLDNIGRFGTIRQGDVQALSQLYSATKGSYSIPSSSGGGGGGGAGGLFGAIGSIIGGIF